MTRFSKAPAACRILLSLFLAECLPVGACAQDFVSDAFGMYRADGDAGARASWSGVAGTQGGGQVTVEAGDIDALLFFLGPKSLVAGRDKGHAVAIAVDEWGNLIADGTTGELVLGDLTVAVETRRGIADHLFQPQPLAGQFLAGLSMGDQQTSRAEFRVTSDLSSVKPAIAETGDQPLTRETFHLIATSDLSDRFGNSIEDGVALQMLIDLAGGTTTRLTAMTREGLALSTFLTRDVEGAGNVRATLGHITSTSAPVTIRDMGVAGPLAARAFALPDIEALRIRLGPFLTDAGYALNDGAQVRIGVRSGTGRFLEIDGWVRDGYFETILTMDQSDLPATLAVHTLLGVQTIDLSADDLDRIDRERHME